MYIVNTEITARWNLAPTDSPLAESAYDIRVVPPTLEGTYTNDGVVNYIAPSENYGGTLSYIFTPMLNGRWTIYLTTGTGANYQIIGEKTLWVFLEAPTRVGSTIALSVSSIPVINIFNTSSQGYDNQWNVIDGLCQDPSNPHIIWFCGEHAPTDAKASIASIDTVTGEITEYLEVVNFSSGKVCYDMAMNENGRIVITDGALYRAYYSDAPYTTWTQCTHVDWNPSFSIVKGLEYDPYLGVYWWLTQSALGVSSDGITFYTQKYDFAGDDVLEYNVESSKFIQRIALNSNNVLYSMSSPFGGGDQGIFAWPGVPPIGSLPVPWENIDGNTDLYGPGVTSGSVIAIAPALDKNSVWAISVLGFMIQAVGGVNFSYASVVDISSDITGTPIQMFTIHDFGKSFLVCDTGGSLNYYESTDMVTWVVSTDERLTNYTINALDAKICHYFDDSGIAFVDHVSLFNDQIVAMV